MSNENLIGIVRGSVAAFFLIVYIIFLIVRKKRRKTLGPEFTSMMQYNMDSDLKSIPNDET